MTTRSEIPAAWLDSHAWAAVTLYRHGRPAEMERILERIQVAGQYWHGAHLPARETYRFSVLALADACEAVCRLINAAQHPGGLAAQFTDLDTGEVADPGDFLYDVDGRAAVWATRALVAAANGDAPALEGLLPVVADLPNTVDGIAAALVHLNRATVGAAPLVALQVDADNLADLGRTLDGMELPLYDWQCVDWCATDVGHRTGSRDVRELGAAEHVLTYAHIVTRETRWT